MTEDWELGETTVGRVCVCGVCVAWCGGCGGCTDAWLGGGRPAVTGSLLVLWAQRTMTRCDDWKFEVDHPKSYRVPGGRRVSVCSLFLWISMDYGEAGAQEIGGGPFKVSAVLVIDSRSVVADCWMLVARCLVSVRLVPTS